MNPLPNPLAPGDHEYTLQHNGSLRSYLVHVPQEYGPQQSTAVVLAFHGGGTNAGGMQRFSGLSEKADAAGFVVVYPNGTGREAHSLWWNTGVEYKSAPHNKADDVGFVSALLDELHTKLNIDPARIYVTGMSNGGMLCYQLAAELSDRIAAMASVGGTMLSEELDLKRPVPVLHIHGTEDHFVPFEGGRGKRSVSRMEYRSVRQTIAKWVTANHCQEVPVISDFPVLVEDGTTIRRKTYTGEAENSEVVLFVVDGGGHTWPGRKPPLLFLGKSTQNLSANDVIWKFFNSHRLQNS